MPAPGSPSTNSTPAFLNESTTSLEVAAPNTLGSGTNLPNPCTSQCIDCCNSYFFY